MTGFRPGKDTWPFRAMLSALESELTVRNIEKDFDAELFVKDDKAALLKQTTPEMIKIFEKTSNMAGLSDTVRITLEYEMMHWEEREPTWQDIAHYVRQPNTAVTCNVNARALYGNRDGWTGHFVLVVEANDDEIVLDDPGNPPEQHAIVKKEDFLNAWSREPAVAQDPEGLLRHQLEVTEPEYLSRI